LSHLPIRSHALLHKRIVIDDLIREIKMNAVLLHDAQRCARFRKRWSVNFAARRDRQVATACSAAEETQEFGA